MKKRKLCTLIFAIFLVGGFLAALQPSSKGYMVYFSLSRISGPVGTNVFYTGYDLNLSVPYTVWFDVNGDGNPFGVGESISTGTASGDFGGSFRVPECAGNDTGRLHWVALRNNIDNSYVRANFSVVTSRLMNAPQARMGNNITLTLNVTGAGPSETRQYGVRVTRPDGTLSAWYNFSQATSNLGTLSRNIMYPRDFSTTPPVVIGNYTVQAFETVPAPTHIINSYFLVLQNDAPTATINSITPSSPQAGQQITFAGSGSDINGSIIAYLWVSNLTGRLSTSSTFNATLSAGTHLISFYVQDADGLWSNAATRTINVVPPSNLTAVIDSITVNSSVSPPQVTFTGYGVDSNWQITNYMWETVIGGTQVSLSNASTFTTASLPSGNYTISFRVQNSQGTWSTASTQQLTIQPPIPATAVIDSVLPNPARPGQPVMFTGHGIIANGAIVGYQWTSNRDGVIGNSESFSTSTLSTGVHTISFSVQNNDLAWSPAVTIILEVSNNYPTATVDRSVTPDRIRESLQVNFAGSGIDADGSIEEYSWSSDIDGQLSDTASFTTTSLSVGNHIISFTVRDNAGAWSQPAILNIEIVANQPPVATIDIAPSSVPQGTTVTLTGHGDDPDGSITGYRWTSSIDDQFGDSASVTTSGLSEGTHTIIFEVQDDSGIWSLQATRPLEITPSEDGFDSTAAVTVTGAIAASAIIGTTYYMNNLPRSAKFNKNYREKVEKEKTRQEKKKKKQEKEQERRRREGKPALELKGVVPSGVFGQQHEPAILTLKNTGSAEAKNVIPSYNADTGVVVKPTSNAPFNLPAGKSMPLLEPFEISPQTRRGIYRLFFQAGCQNATSLDVICLFRNFKIGLLTTPSTSALAEPIRTWMTKKGYSYDELQSADNLRSTLNKYDIVILAPELQLTDRWVRNLSTYVKNSQSLLVIDKVTATSQNTQTAAKLAELLGYQALKFEPFEYGAGQLELTSNPLSADLKLSLKDQTQLQTCTGNHCTSTTTATVLSIYNPKDDDGNKKFPAVIANVYGKAKGRIIHLNFRAQEATNQLDSLLEKTFKWLLRIDELPQ